ncbi:hypothetical protein B0H10DRAFT_2437708 [Mycena sp. CBHHK59/15]|nr:hypothetical protein B0H10DRAFT_2437708 [Mycena sp. CBHHK59/15]
MSPAGSPRSPPSRLRALGPHYTPQRGIRVRAGAVRAPGADADMQEIRGCRTLRKRRGTRLHPPPWYGFPAWYPTQADSSRRRRPDSIPFSGPHPPQPRPHPPPRAPRPRMQLVPLAYQLYPPTANVCAQCACLPTPHTRGLPRGYARSVTTIASTALARCRAQAHIRATWPPRSRPQRPRFVPDGTTRHYTAAAHDERAQCLPLRYPAIMRPVPACEGRSSAARVSRAADADVGHVPRRRRALPCSPPSRLRPQRTARRALALRTCSCLLGWDSRCVAARTWTPPDCYMHTVATIS